MFLLCENDLSTTTSTFLFFFQAEAGIRALYVTGVQTCALPIYFVQHRAADGHPAGPQKPSQMPEQSGAFLCQKIYPVNIAGNDHAVWPAIRINLVVTVSDNSNCRVLLQGFERPAKLLFGPPIIAVQHGNNFSLRLGQSKIEGRSLASVGL